MIGFFCINKQSDMSSSNVVSKLKKRFDQKQIGHMGTLDPLATGVLPIAVSKATRLFDYFSLFHKTYVGTFQFGISTDSLDITGKVIEENNITFSKKQIEDVLPKFIGEITQIPPKYSALKINGERAYNLARKNVDFEIKPRKTIIYNIKLIGVIENYFSLEIECSSGTYIRSLGFDITSSLGGICTMTKLERTKVGPFVLDKSFLIEDVTEKNIIKIDEAFDFEKINLDYENFFRLKNGVGIDIDKYRFNSIFAFAYYNEKLLGIVEKNNGILQLKTYLYEE